MRPLVTKTDKNVFKLQIVLICQAKKTQIHILIPKFKLL